MTKDEASALHLSLMLAHQGRVSLADQVANDLRHARSNLRSAYVEAARVDGDDRAKERRQRWLARQMHHAVTLWAWQTTYASMRGEHPDARLPEFKDKTRACEPQVAEIAARLQDGVERRVWESLYGKGEQNGQGQ